MKNKTGKVSKKKRIIAYLLTMIMALSLVSEMSVVAAEEQHDMEEIEAKEATCTESGNIAYKKCSRCDYYTDLEGNEIDKDSWIIPATGHKKNNASVVFNWTQDKVTGEWTCPNATYVCENCGAEITVDCTVTSDTKEPTCTEKGWLTYRATVKIDGKDYTYIKEQSISALGHDMEAVEATEPTCTYVGNIAYKKCSRCNYHTDLEGNELTNYSWIIPVKGHLVTDLEPDSVCFKWFQEEESGEWFCYVTYTCERCNEEVHTHCLVEKRTIIEPTCTEEGRVELIASEYIGGREYSDFREESLPALGHDMEEVEAKEATCTEEGTTAYKKCIRCDCYTDLNGNEIEKDSWIIPAKGHKIDVTGKITVQPTYSQSGVYTYNVCKNGCGKKTEVKLPQKQIYVMIGKTYTIPTNSAYKMTLLNASSYSKYLKFNSKTGKIWTSSNTKYLKILKPAIVKVTVGSTSYNININYLLKRPKITIKKTSVGNNYKYKFTYNIKGATKIRVRVLEASNNKKLNKILDKYISKPKSKSSSYFTTSKKNVKKIGTKGKLTFQITIYYGYNYVTFVMSK
ncbi:MAG: hypothetical protein ACI4S2_18175 [Lachnospiraceae bacterium]